MAGFVFNRKQNTEVLNAIAIIIGSIIMLSVLLALDAIIAIIVLSLVGLDIMAVIIERYKGFPKGSLL